MKIIEQTSTRMVVRYIPVNDWLNTLIIMVIVIYLMSFLQGTFLYSLLCFLSILIALYWGTVRLTIITCLVDKPTKTIKVMNRSLIGTPIHEEHNFLEILQIEIQEKRWKNGKYYKVYLLLKSSQRIFLGKKISIWAFNDSHYIKETSRNLADFIGCSYSFMPAPASSFWNF